MDEMIELTERQRYWLTHIEASEQSGLSARGYADKHGLKVSGLNNARHRLKAKNVLLGDSAEQAQASQSAPSEPRARFQRVVVKSETRADSSSRCAPVSGQGATPYGYRRGGPDRRSRRRRSLAMMRLSDSLPEVLVCCDSVDFSKGINGLSLLVEQALGQNPFSERLFVFTNRHQDKVKILCLTLASCRCLGEVGLWSAYCRLSGGQQRCATSAQKRCSNRIPGLLTDIFTLTPQPSVRQKRLPWTRPSRSRTIACWRMASNPSALITLATLPVAAGRRNAWLRKPFSGVLVICPMGCICIANWVPSAAFVVRAERLMLVDWLWLVGGVSTT